MKLNELIEGKSEFNIGFIGGSITRGYSSSKAEYCYAGQVCERIGKLYPDTKINWINAGVGGTTSALGLFRLDWDLISKSPDLVFIEFAINDEKLETTGIFMENIIREVHKYNANVPVVLLITTSVNAVKTYSLAKNMPSSKQHYALSEHYNLLIINVGDEMYQKSVDEGIPFDDFFADGLHPNDKGHSAYADAVMSALENAELNTINPELPLLYGRRIKNPSLLMCTDMADDKWKLSESIMYDVPLNYIYSYTSGDELKFEFTGTILGIYYTAEKDSGIIEFKVDDGEWQEKSLWDKYAIGGGRAHYLPLCDKLPSGRHTVIVKNSEKKDERSEGHYIRIGAFTIGD